jgi:hypothetical protein
VDRIRGDQRGAKGYRGFLKGQSRTGVPVLPSSNRFAVLPVEDYENNDTPFLDSQPLSARNNPTPIHPPRPRFKGTCWQIREAKTLAAKLDLVAKTSSQPIKLSTKIEVTSTGSRYQVKGLVNSGASFQFLDAQFIHENGIPILQLPQPIPVYNIDSTKNQAGAINQVVDVILNVQGHSKHTMFTIMNLGDQQMILGQTWLANHNPEIDWS